MIFPPGEQDARAHDAIQRKIQVVRAHPGKVLHQGFRFVDLILVAEDEGFDEARAQRGFLVRTKVKRLEQGLRFGVFANLPVAVGKIKKLLRDIAFWKSRQAAQRLERRIEGDSLLHVAGTVGFGGFFDGRWKIELRCGNGAGRNCDGSVPGDQIQLSSREPGDVCGRGPSRLAIGDKRRVASFRGRLALGESQAGEQQPREKKASHGVQWTSWSFCISSRVRFASSFKPSFSEISAQRR